MLHPDIPTMDGIRVGDSADRLQDLYGDELSKPTESSSNRPNSYVRWIRRGDVDIVFDIVTEEYEAAGLQEPKIWSISLLSARDEDYHSTWQSGETPGACD